MLIHRQTVNSLISVHVMIAVYWINTLITGSALQEKHLLTGIILKITGLIIEAIQSLLLVVYLKYLPLEKQNRMIARNLVEYSTILNYVTISLMILVIIVFGEKK